MSLFRSTPSGDRVSKVAPRLEALEDRTVPVVTSWSFNNGTLLINCNDPAADRVELRELAGGDVRVLHFDGNTKTFDQTFADPSTILINTFGGDDTVTYDLARTTTNTWARDITVNLGDGNDTWDATLRGTLVGPHQLRMVVFGTAGNDTLTTSMIRDVKGGMLGLSYDGGAGADTIAVDFANPPGVNETDVDIWSTATVWMNLWGGDGNDVIDVDYQGDLDGRLLMNAEGNAGNDVMSADFVLDAGSTGRVGDGGPPSSDHQTEWNRVARMLGGDGQDSLHYNVQNSGTAQVTAEMWGQLGADSFSGNVPIMDLGVI